MKKSAAKQNEVALDNDSKKQHGFQRQLKLVAGKLSELSQLSGEKLSLVSGKEKVLWTSEKPKAQKKPVARKKPAAKKKGPPGAGRPEKTETKTTVDELQAMREAKAQRARAQLQGKKKPLPAKKAEAKSQQKAFSVNREAPVAAKKKKRA